MFFFGNDLKWLHSYAHVSSGGTVQCGSKLPNRWGLFDMVGNVWEFTWDYLDEPTEPILFDPVGKAEGDDWLIRGGAYDSGTYDCRASWRFHPTWLKNDVRPTSKGFRVVCCPVAPSAADVIQNRIEACTRMIESLPNEASLLKTKVTLEMARASLRIQKVVEK